jgi:hypothetical protein
MQLIEEFKNYTRGLFNQFHEIDPAKRSVWTPACPFHGDEHFGTISDPLTAAYQIPGLSGNTLGVALHEFHYNNGTGKYVDQVSWPNNKMCAHVFG